MGNTCIIATVPSGFGWGGVANATPFVWLSFAVSSLQRVDVGLTVGRLGGQHERAVEAGAESLGDEVVGLARGVAVGPVAGVGEAEAHRQQRDRQHEEEDQAEDRPPATGGAG